MYSCEKCKKLRNGVKFTNLIKSPNILSIHFKRFRNELMFSSKISTYVSFPMKDLKIITHQVINNNNENQTTEQQLEQLENSNNNNNSQNNKSLDNNILSNSNKINSINNNNQNEEEDEEEELRNSSNNQNNNSNNSNNNNQFRTKRKLEYYDLVSVICHRGHYNSGHYITYAFKLFR